MELNKIHHMDCLQGLKTLPDNSVDCCVTSPPYFGLRDYGYDEQIGLEETPDLYVQKLVDVFTEVKRVLKKEGTLWLNLGDSYNGNKIGKTETNKNKSAVTDSFAKKLWKGAKPKDLIGIPWLTAFALRNSGWYLRQDIIWHKPNPMPESVTDRCTKSHEYIFLLSKSAKYYFDNDAIKESSVSAGQYRKFNTSKKEARAIGVTPSGNEHPNALPVLVKDDRNKRSVWTETTKPIKDAHFAAYPETLIEDCVKAGCPENGIILDPFMGAGTTAVVASKLNRKYIGFELNADYIRIAEKRIYNAMGIFKDAI